MADYVSSHSLPIVLKVAGKVVPENVKSFISAGAVLIGTSYRKAPALREALTQPFSESHLTLIESESARKRNSFSQQALKSCRSAMFFDSAAGSADILSEASKVVIVAFDFDKTIAFPHSEHSSFLHEG